MPIYEFVCEDCRKVFQFFFRSASSVKKPKCPKCGKRGMSKRFSRFAVGAGSKTSRSDGEGGGAGGGPGDGMDDVDPVRMESAMRKLEREMSGLDENDPKQMGHFMRRMMEETGQSLGPEMETAIRRLEAGEDPEKIEEDMGDLLGEEPGSGGMDDYSYDDTLYEG